LTRLLQQQQPSQPSQQPESHHARDFLPLFAMNQISQTKYSFSIGIGATSDIPFRAASYEAFVQAPLFLFYRTGLRHFKYHSNRFRHLLMELLQNDTATSKSNNELSSTLSLLSSHSSIGYDLPAARWLQDLTLSKFCLVLRGDTPHSHSLLRAIKVGCLPVIVSDYYEEYAPIFRSTLRLHDVAIFISEHEFLTRPVESLDKLRQWSEHDLKVKLQVLNMAQRIVLPDHPESLFVPAFLKESYLTATSSSRLPASPSDTS
jgi:hypothetical protein